jgi:hypothetical protein
MSICGSGLRLLALAIRGAAWYVPSEVTAAFDGVGVHAKQVGQVDRREGHRGPVQAMPSIALRLRTDPAGRKRPTPAIVDALLG